MKKDIILSMLIFGLLLVVRDDVWLAKESVIQNFFADFIGDVESVGVVFTYEAISHDFGIAYWSNASMHKLKRVAKKQWTPAEFDALKAKIQVAIDAHKVGLFNVPDDDVQGKCESIGLTKKPEDI